MDIDKKRRLFRIPRGGQISLRDMLLAWWPALLVLAVAFGIAYQFVKPAPPDNVVIVTGAQDGAYYAFAERYREVLARNFVRLEVRPSSGSVENYRLLKDGASGVDIGFVQGGVGSASEAPEQISLGRLYYEPAWVFYRASESLDRLTQLTGKRIAIGPEGSGTRKLAIALLGANNVQGPATPLLDLSGLAAAEALTRGEIDAAFIVAAPEAPAVRELLHAQNIRLMSFTHAEAYTRYFPFLSVVTLPRGAIDLTYDIPPYDVQLLSPAANLVARRDMHPAIVGLLVAAASEVHGGSGLLQHPGEFPSAKGTDFPINAEALRYYRSGPPFLQRYLPFWAANLVDRMIVLLVPMIALMIPLMRILPWLYNWRIRSRIYRHYGELRFLEDEVSRHPLSGKINEYMERLDKIDDHVNHLPIPLAFQEQTYTLRAHIDLVRARIGKLTGSAAQ
jgi:TRAP transporter TAXI family solute receptor